MKIATRWFLPVFTSLMTLFIGVAPCRAQRFEARIFEQQDGLGNISVTAIVQDRVGFLWVGTENGLFRYDGARFQEFGRSQGFAKPSIYSLHVDHQGIIWAGTHNGLYWFDGGAFREVRYHDQSLRIGQNSMLASTTAGELIAASSKGMFSITRTGGGWNALPYVKRHPSMPEFDDTSGVAVDASDHLWFGCRKAICEFAEPRLTTFGVQQGVPADYYVAFLKTRDGTLWARGREHLIAWKPGQDIFQNRDLNFTAGASKTIFRRMTEDAYGEILTPTAKGLALWNGNRWTGISRTSAGTLGGAHDVFSDREGSIWIGSQSGGLVQSLGYRLWENYGEEEGLATPEVFAIAADAEGRIWVGGDAGVSIFGPSTHAPASPRRLALVQASEDSTVQSLAPSPDGGIWIGTLLGHVYHVNSSGRPDIRASFDAYIGRIRLDPSGRLWVATNQGLLSLRCAPGNPCAAEPYPDPRLAQARIGEIALDASGALWVASDSGLDRIRGGQLKHFTVIGADSQSFSYLAIDKDNLWLAGQSPGVLRVVVHESTARVAETFARPQLTSDYVEFLETDQRGRTWVGTDQGINLIEHGLIFHITHDDGLVWNDTNDKAFLAAKDGSIWFGTSRGLSHLLRTDWLERARPFSAVVEDADYNGHALQQGSTFKWDGGALILHFSSVTFLNNRSMVYHYRLDGFDPSIITTHLPFVRFQHLPPGRYTFHVTAEDGRGSPSTAEFGFTLSPPWWRTSIFYAFCLLIGVALLAFIWHWSNQALLAQREKLQRLVRQRTRELEEMAIRDGLTGVLNRRAILDALQAELERLRSEDGSLHVALLDLDHFKQVNDTFGHLAGDEVLRESARRFTACVRETDFVGRYGGEEFLILLIDAPEEQGFERCEEICKFLSREPIRYQTLDLNITCSVGVASIQSGKTVEELIAAADRAMYAAKSMGRNRVEYSMVS